MHQVPRQLAESGQSKVPAATLLFWIVKMMSTTVGETAADLVNVRLGLGLAGTTAAFTLLFALSLVLQLWTRSYVPWRYWTTVMVVSVLGTLLTDNLTDVLAVPLWLSVAIFGVLLVVLFAIWYRQEATLSIDDIDTPRRELLYWCAIVLTFALGTAVGDWLSEALHLGYATSAMVFTALIAITVLARLVLDASAVTCFWIAYILTRPLGASGADLLAQDVSQGGLGFGTISTSVIFLIAIVAAVGYLHVVQEDEPA